MGSGGRAWLWDVGGFADGAQISNFNPMIECMLILRIVSEKSVEFVDCVLVRQGQRATTDMVWDVVFQIWTGFVKTASPCMKKQSRNEIVKAEDVRGDRRKHL